ncbi:MAG: efflux RND transporter permease subunit, partial [Bacteroidota bacterium]
LAGALLTLWYFNQTLNIFSQIGIIMLIGLVTKNGILIVEFANQRKETGMAVLPAVIGAAESRVSMGIGVIGGMLFSTLLTLFVIPAIYSYFTAKHVAKAAHG